jgi:hypothetical protein
MARIFGEPAAVRLIAVAFLKLPARSAAALARRLLSFVLERLILQIQKSDATTFRAISARTELVAFAFSCALSRQPRSRRCRG